MAEPDSSLTPEQQLLSMIEGESPASPSSAPPEGVKQKEQKKSLNFDIQSLLTPAGMRKTLLSVRTQLAFLRQAGGGFLSLKKVNKVFAVFVFGMSCFLMADIGYTLISVSHGIESQSLGGEKKIAELPLSPVYTLSPFFFDDMTKRNVFKPIEKRAAEEVETEKSKMSLRLVEITKNMRLTGISVNPADPNRTFCMIEDVKKDLTSFLKAGDTISGLTVETINSDVVVLSFGEEKIELR